MLWFKVSVSKRKLHMHWKCYFFLITVVLFWTYSDSSLGKTLWIPRLKKKTNTHRHMCLTAILQARSIHILYDMQCHDLFGARESLRRSQIFYVSHLFRLSWIFEFVSNLERVADCIFIVEDIVFLHVGVSIRIASFRVRISSTFIFYSILKSNLPIQNISGNFHKVVILTLCILNTTSSVGQQSHYWIWVKYCWKSNHLSTQWIYRQI